VGYLNASNIWGFAVLQTSTDIEYCRQGSILDRVSRKSRFTVLPTCEKVIGMVLDIKGIKEDDGDYQFNLDVEEPYKRLLDEEYNKQ
jgi:hypothetical protein